MQTTDVLVIGAGIVGAACAHALAQVGLSVRIIDARLGGATAAGMGHLVVMDDNPAELALSKSSLDLWHTWAPQIDAGCAFTACGTLWLAANEEELQAAHAKRATLQAQDVACEMLDAGALARAEPALRTGLAGALKVKGDSVVYAPRAAQWLVAQAAAHGTVVVEQAEATQIDGQTVTLRDGSQRSAGAIVLASGIHAPQLCPGLPLRPKKGHLVITDRYPGTVRHQLVELGYITSAHHSDGTSVAFNVQPRPTGQLLIGSSREFDTTDPTVNNTVMARMLQRALDYLPGLADLNAIRTWTGFRAATPDSLPLIGGHPEHPHLWLAVGHEGLGVTTAPATAQLLAAQISGGTPAINPAPYAPARFAGLSTP
ncbi:MULTISPECIES: FAD-binding oxidoreductase [unclassified Acidovorax]|uniref:NAD(P)/FAD-dependent oxidoreductase n=1 Tax=unclassified Acidovorax TaxID=2684926 RepID=UPI0007022C2D|nr:MULTISPECIES: FAD-dependent oxidoreductase [unclassified Acidovorax]KRB28594.1 D-amino acid oxidase [Acidovorax sp. Root70]PUA96747.1 glycine/D-amino acid oxidase-like deaminating enzyme [Acidovorax sp. 107]